MLILKLLSDIQTKSAVTVVDILDNQVRVSKEFSICMGVEIEAFCFVFGSCGYRSTF